MCSMLYNQEKHTRRGRGRGDKNYFTGLNKLSCAKGRSRPQMPAAETGADILLVHQTWPVWVGGSDHGGPSGTSAHRGAPLAQGRERAGARLALRPRPPSTSARRAARPGEEEGTDDLNMVRTTNCSTFYI